MGGFDFDSAASSMSKALEIFSRQFKSLQDSSSEVELRKLDIPTIENEESVENRRDALIDVLGILAEVDASNALDDEKIDGLASFFISLYRHDSEHGVEFRHMYSDVCKLMYGFLNDEDYAEMDDGVPFKNRYLENNIVIIEDRLRSREDCPREALDGIGKLHDHIALENRRMGYMAFQNRAQKDNAARLEKHFSESIKKEVEKASESFKNDAQEERKRLQREHIAVLGIFASIIIAFTSGMAFSSSVLQNIEKASIYRLSFIVLIVGLFVFLMISALFMFLNKISGTKNGAMIALLIIGSIVFLLLIAAVVVARALDVLSFFPIPPPS